MKSDEILQLANFYEAQCLQLVKCARIRKLPNGKYRVLSEKGKNLGTSSTKEDAEKRLHQVEYFKHKDENKADDFIDLRNTDDFSYSAIVRKLRTNASKDQVKVFLKLFKNQFDRAVKNKLQKPEKVALQNALIAFNKKHPIKLKKKLVKNAAISELGAPTLVGKYLADIVRFTLNRIDPDKRVKVIHNLKHKFYAFDANEISNKNLPATSSIGQSITFVKTVLFNQSPQYIREVLNNLIRNL